MGFMNLCHGSHWIFFQQSCKFSYEIKISLLQKEPIAGVLDKTDGKILKILKKILEVQFFIENLQSESSNIFQEHLYPADK